MTRLVLASRSPRRIELLQQLGHPVVVEPADIDETPEPGESAAALVERLALTKAGTVAHRVDLDPGDIVVGADTVVSIGDTVLGKPADDADATAMLHRLSGRTHQAVTGCALVAQGIERSFVVVTDVVFAELADATIDAYVATGQPQDKAGAYAIQGGAGRFVLEVHGSYQNIVGLPLAQLAAALAEIESFRSATPER